MARNRKPSNNDVSDVVNSIESARQKLWDSMTEAQFQREVIRLAQQHKWRVAHFRTAMNKRGHYMTPVAADGAGFPDLLMIRGQRVIAAELKTNKGRTSAQQKQWLAAFEETPVETFLWRPRDQENIHTTLKGDTNA